MQSPAAASLHRSFDAEDDIIWRLCIDTLDDDVVFLLRRSTAGDVREQRGSGSDLFAGTELCTHIWG
jgi:hypothetical protein